MVDLDSSRVQYIKRTWDVNENCSKALILAQIGYSNSGIANVLNMTEGTINRYQNTVEEKIGEDAWMVITQNTKKYDVWP